MSRPSLYINCFLECFGYVHQVHRQTFFWKWVEDSPEKMSKNSNQVILQLYARTPAPCRDYCGLTITNEEVTLNVWNITFGPHVYPKRFKCSLENLTENKFIQSEIGRVFGEHVVDYTKSLSNNELRLENLSTKTFLSILKYVAAKDILSLSQTSKILFERCNDDKIWSLMFRKLFKRSPSQNDLLQIEETGWKKHILDKLTLHPYYSFHKKKTVVEVKSIEDSKISKLRQNEFKSETYLVSEKNTRNNLVRKTDSNANLTKFKSPSKTLLQVKNDLKINSTNSGRLKPNVQVPKNNNTAVPLTKTDKKPIAIKKPLPKPPLEKIIEKKSILKNLNFKLLNAKPEKKVGAKNVVIKKEEKK